MFVPNHPARSCISIPKIGGAILVVGTETRQENDYLRGSNEENRQDLIGCTQPPSRLHISIQKNVGGILIAGAKLDKEKIIWEVKTKETGKTLPCCRCLCPTSPPDRASPSKKMVALFLL